MASTPLRNVLEKMDNSDSDYRYMATSDLLQQLQNSSLRTDPDTQKRLCRAVLKLLKDTNSEVQGMALKCLAPLAMFVEPTHTTYIIGKLTDYVLDSGTTKPRVGGPDNVSVKAMRDISALGLKAILSETEADGATADTITKALAPRLVEAVRTTSRGSGAHDVLIEVLELLRDCLTRMGPLLVDKHDGICKAIFRQLPSSNGMISKRAIACIGALSASCEKSLFVAIVEKTIAFLRSDNSLEAVRTGVQLLSALSKASGHRLAAHVPVLSPILFDYSMSEKFEEEDELREHCVQALGAFCLRCKREMVNFSKLMVECVVKLGKYDPNYVEDDDEDNQDDEENGMDGEDDMDAEFGDDEDYSDDDDSSWKVRRAAIRCLQAAVSVELLPRAELCEVFGPFLVTRFKEREEPVKLDVFTAFADLLRLCSNQARNPLPSSGSRFDSGYGDPMAVDVEDEIRAELSPLSNQGQNIMRSLKIELSSRSLKTRIKAMGLLRDVVAAIPSVVLPQVSKVLPEVEQGLGDNATAIKIESLLFLRRVVNGGGVETLKDHVGIIIPKVLSAANDSYYKVTAECLRFCGETIVEFGSATPECAESLSPLVPSIHDMALQRAIAQDQDSEVKEAALYCLGASVSCFSQDLGMDRIGNIAAVFHDRLGNEVTRLATVRALYAVAQSEAANILVPLMNGITDIVGSFLRKSSRLLRAAALDFFSVAPVLPQTSNVMLISNISELITDSDLRMTCMALNLAARIVSNRGNEIVAEVAKPDSVYNRAISLTTSPLLQGPAVDALIELFRTLAEVNSPPLQIAVLLEELAQKAASVSAQVSMSSARSSPLHCVAKCIVAVCDSAESSARSMIAEQIISDVGSLDVRGRVFSLICLGEFGRSSRVIKSPPEKERVRSVILSSLDSEVDEIRTASALAFGGITAADGASGISTLLPLMNERPHQRYLLLISLKDAISSSDSIDLAPVIPMLLPMLLSKPMSMQNDDSSDADRGDGKRASEEESVRTATAECLGVLACFSPEVVMRSLSDAAISDEPYLRALAPSAVMFAVNCGYAKESGFTSSLRSSAGDFVQLIEDTDVSVARNALQAVNAIAKSRPSLLAPHLQSVSKLIFARLTKDKSLVRVVDLGPFKHEEDYGLDMRKAAFDCIRTFVSGPLCASIQLTTLVQNIIVGLNDHADVRAIAQLILATSAATSAAAELVAIIDPIVLALESTFAEKVKQNAVRQEAERHDDSIRGALRAVRMLESVPEISRNRRFQGFMNNVIRTSDYVDKYKAIGKSDVELMTFGHITGAENGIVGEGGDVVMSDR